MILTTAHAIEGKKIVAHHGIVSSEAILGANILKDFLIPEAPLAKANRPLHWDTQLGVRVR